jgi:hypothetical protein
MRHESIPEKNKIPGLCYVFTKTGIELPVLDITHPMFISSVDKVNLDELRKESIKAAKGMKDIPDSQKKLFYEKSLIFGKHFHKDLKAKYLSGMSTYMLKLGPYLIGSAEERNLDRMISMGVSSVAARMRLRDLCHLQSDGLVPQLKRFPQKELCFLNIGGGAASDSINALILILKENQSLLENRKTGIHVFDIDTDSTLFAQRCVEALKAQGSHFYNQDISFNHIEYDWKDTEELIGFLSEKKESLIMCTSEGGIFEYGSDEEIINNLNILYDYSPADMMIAATAIHDIHTVDPIIPAMAEVSGGALRFLGVEGLNSILEKTPWKLARMINQNPVYITFTLKKDKKY